MQREYLGHWENNHLKPNNMHGKLMRLYIFLLTSPVLKRTYQLCKIIFARSVASNEVHCLIFIIFKTCKDNSYVNVIKYFNTKNPQIRFMLFSRNPVTVG